MKIKQYRVIFTLLLSFIPACLFAQQVGGVVTDSTNGEPVIGASILVKGTTNGVLADLDGKYSIKAKSGDVLVCQCIGYKDAEVTVGTAAVVDFALEPDTQTLEATVVVGYGTLKKKQLVGAVENISGEKLEDRMNPNVARSLEGQVAGLNIIQTDGKPNHTGQIYIRGGSTSYKTRSSMDSAGQGNHSIGQGGSALILIDGVEGSLTSVNPDDIETISVLKDASSAAVYGARGAFGVILVKTKNSDTEKISVGYQGSVTLNRRTVIWEDQIESDGLAWTESFYDFFQGCARTPGIEGKVPTAMNQYNLGFFTVPSGDKLNYLEYFRYRRNNGIDSVYGMDDNGNYAYFASTNWIDEIYKDYSFAQSHAISVSGKAKKLSFRVTGRYYGQDGIYKIGKEKYDKYNFRAKVGAQITDWLSIDSNTYFYRNFYTQPFASTQPMTLSTVYYAMPIFPILNEDGSNTYGASRGGYVPFRDGNSYQYHNNLSFYETLGVDIEPVKDVLKFRADFTYKIHRNELTRVKASNAYSMSPGSTTYETDESQTYKTWGKTDNDILNANIVGTYTPKLGDNHDLNLMLGWNMEDYRRDYKYVSRHGFLYDELPSFELMDDGGSETTTINLNDNDGNASYGLVGFFGRLNYTLLKRYIFEFSARADGSSKFPKDSKWGFFPSGSVGWRISEEPWMHGTRSWLDNWKLRGNYGSLGNANISAYQYQETIGISRSGVIFNGARLPVAGAPATVPDGLTWETVTTWDVGTDIDLLQSRLSASADFYVRNTDNLYINGPEIPAIYGASSPKGNYGGLMTRGWELTVSWRDRASLGGKPLDYSVKASVWDSRTWVSKYYNTTGNIFQYYVGKELGEIWGFRTDGYFLSNAEANDWAQDTYHKNGDNFRAYAGDLKFIDKNGDGVIGVGKGTLGDHGDLDRIGNITPRYQYGLDLNFKWNGIGLRMFFQGVAKRDWYPSVESNFFWGQYNRPYAYLMKNQTGNNYVHVDYNNPNWTVTNADSHPYWTRRVGYSANRNVGPLTWENDYYLQNAAYIRLKNLTLDYTIPSNLLKKAKMSQIKLYLAMENLWTWSPIYRHTRAFDPEVITAGDSDFDTTTGLGGSGDGNSYPMLKSYTFGINITF